LENTTHYDRGSPGDRILVALLRWATSSIHGQPSVMFGNVTFHHWNTQWRHDIQSDVAMSFVSNCEHSPKDERRAPGRGHLLSAFALP